MPTKPLPNKCPTAFSQQVGPIYQSLLKLYGKQVRWWPADSIFEVMIGAILGQNTAWTNVEKAIDNLKAHIALTPDAILTTPAEQLGIWIRPSGYFNQKTKRLLLFCKWLSQTGGIDALTTQTTQALRGELLALNGIGPETADGMLLYGLDRPVFIIDAYTRRIFSRLGLINGDEPYEILRDWFETHLENQARLFQQYHALIVQHGKHSCTKKPRCEPCSLKSTCFHYNREVKVNKP